MTEDDDEKVDTVMHTLNSLITECWESDDISDLSRVANKIKEYDASKLSHVEMISVLMCCFRIRHAIKDTILQFYDDCAVELEKEGHNAEDYIGNYIEGLR